MRTFDFTCPPFAGTLDPLQDDKLINSFPWLVVHPIDNAERLALENQHSVLVGENVRFKQLLREIAKARVQARRKAGDDAGREDLVRIAGQRALHEQYADAYGLQAQNFEDDIAALTGYVVMARLTIERLLETFMPLHLRPRLRMNAEVANAQDPIRLLRLCAQGGKDSNSRLASFEAKRQGLIAQLEFERDRLHRSSSTQLGNSMAWFTDLCTARYFIPRKSDQLTVVADLDSENHNRVKQFQVLRNGCANTHEAPTPTRFILPLDVRFIEWKGAQVPVLFETRVKEDVALKNIRQRERFKVPHDLLGVKLVFFSEKELRAGVARMRETLVRAPGTVWGERSNLFRAGVLDDTNIHSSSEYRAWKFYVILDGRAFEVQLVLIEDAINEIVAHERENHPFYKATAYMDLVFPALFPYELYHIDWSDDSIRRRLLEYQLAKF